MSTATLEREREGEAEGARCPDCGGPPRPDGIETVCDECGLVLDVDATDRGPYWAGKRRTDAKHTGGQPGRHSGPMMDRTRGAFGSFIGYDSIPLQGHMNRLRREHRRAIRDDVGRERSVAHNEIDRMAVSAGLPPVAAEAARRLFDRAHDAELAIGRSIEGLAAGALVAAARIHGFALPFDDVVALSRVDIDDIKLGYKTLTNGLGVPVPPPAPHRLVASLCERLGLGQYERTTAERLAREAADDLSGRKPAGVAAGAIYVACGGTVSQRAICEVADCCAVTLRSSAEVVREVADD